MLLGLDYFRGREHLVRLDWLLARVLSFCWCVISKIANWLTSDVDLLVTDGVSP